MRGDLHILFTCDAVDNSARGHTRLGSGPGDFTPAAGRGAVARATLYFMLRYPCKAEGFSRTQIETLLQWHRETPVSDYERLRNSAIAGLQGNRNPLIDHPE